MLIQEQLDDITVPLPQNAMILQLTDGIYTPAISALDSLVPPSHPSTTAQAPVPIRSTSSRILPTSSFDALLRLAKLDDSIQDALTVRNRLASDLEDLLQRNKSALEQRDQVQEAEDRLKTIEYAQMTVQKQVDKARKRIEERRSSLLARQNLMNQDRDGWPQRQKSMELTQVELPHLREEIVIRRKATHAQRRRVCEDLQKIYPIAPIPKQSLTFTIRDLRLPDSEDLDSATSTDDVAAAFGHIAQVLLLISYYLTHPLVYPVNVRGSTSSIEDTISLLKTNASTTTKYTDERSLRTYPLYSKGVPRFRFEYALFLLNKDIQLLLESCFAIRVLDIRQTLPNLKYLLYVATAGEGELPARKAGGVRGLARAGLMSRTASDASSASGFSGLLRKEANGKLKGAQTNVGAAESLRMIGGGRVKKGG
jgi:UV radiation resistance-associated gene protein